MEFIDGIYGIYGFITVSNLFQIMYLQGEAAHMMSDLTTGATLAPQENTPAVSLARAERLR